MLMHFIMSNVSEDARHACVEDNDEKDADINKQGRINGYLSCVQMGGSSAGVGHLGVWAGAMCSTKLKNAEKLKEDRPTDQPTDRPTNGPK